MDSYEAVGICEGFIECDDESKILEAWQHLIDTGMAWTLQGSFGRMARQLIDAGLCHEQKNKRVSSYWWVYDDTNSLYNTNNILLEVCLMENDCVEKRTKEYIEWYKTIPQQIEKVKEEIERENKTNRIMTTTKEQLQKRQEQIMFDLKYKKRVSL